MIDRMAGKIAQWNKGILKLSEEESKVVEYGISVFLDSVFKFLVLLFISIPYGAHGDNFLTFVISLPYLKQSCVLLRFIIIYQCFRSRPGR